MLAIIKTLVIALAVFLSGIKKMKIPANASNNKLLIFHLYCVIKLKRTEYFYSYCMTEQHN